MERVAHELLELGDRGVVVDGLGGEQPGVAWASAENFSSPSSDSACRRADSAYGSASPSQ
ncbi:hypothetical protein [Streptomyces zagrosensis]|uniref:Uncharacterized protein n=1 Tax=Streptomyces zagrosensis TaxID=1042984 RepID=A0A7W9Q7J9_9ACTN|nr:hypothetical protein [Streptomyces zagrosensis]MBB5934971.1 hypothetical protein [Streptomyces zagrosensis]